MASASDVGLRRGKRGLEGEEDEKFRLRGDRGGGQGGEGNVCWTRRGFGGRHVVESAPFRVPCSEASSTSIPHMGSRRMRVITVVVCSPRR